MTLEDIFEAVVSLVQNTREFSIRMLLATIHYYFPILSFSLKNILYFLVFSFFADCLTSSWPGSWVGGFGSSLLTSLVVDFALTVVDVVLMLMSLTDEHMVSVSPFTFVVVVVVEMDDKDVESPGTG